jgi:hypothetical protein
VINNLKYHERSAIDTLEAEEAYQIKSRIKGFNVNFIEVQGAEAYVKFKYKTNKLRKTMINKYLFFGKEHITEQEYGQITFDRIVY